MKKYVVIKSWEQSLKGRFPDNEVARYWTYRNAERRRRFMESIGGPWRSYRVERQA